MLASTHPDLVVQWFRQEPNKEAPMTQHRRAERPIDQQVDDMLEPVRTLMHTTASVQSEFLTLCAQRSAAYLDLPRQISACRSPGDMVEEQIKFLTTMQRNYTNYADAVLRMAQPALEQAERTMGGDGRGQKAQQQRESKPQQQAA
jgi:hypothetical protein